MRLRIRGVQNSESVPFSLRSLDNHEADVVRALGKTEKVTLDRFIDFPGIPVLDLSHLRFEVAWEVGLVSVAVLQ